MRVVVTGATGLVGRALVRALLGRGYEVTVLSRSKGRAEARLPARCRFETWDPDRGVVPSEVLSGAGAILHLAGEGVADQRWSEARKAAIRDSRVIGTKRLVEAITALPEGERPKILVSASAIGFYGDRAAAPLDEESAPGSGFLADVCVDWEAEAARASSLGLRVTMLRIGIVLSREGGALASMLPVFRLGLGGRLGSGEQFMSWIHLDDVVGLFLFALEQEGVCGVWNATAPAPVTNSEFSRILGSVLGRPVLFPVPEWGLRLAVGEMARVVLASQRVLPRAAEAAGYRFSYPELPGALTNLCESSERILEREQWVPRTPDEVFPFFGDAHNLEELTPGFLRFRIEKVSTPEVGAGTLIDYRLRLHGVPVRWRTLIESWQPQESFVDTQIRGPYRLWHHTHEFEPWQGGTILRDRVRYQLPLGALGDLAAGWLVERDVATIFDYRREQIARRFGDRS